VILWVWLVASLEFSGRKPSSSSAVLQPDKKRVMLVIAGIEAQRSTRFESTIDPSDIESLPAKSTLVDALKPVKTARNPKTRPLFLVIEPLGLAKSDLSE
jgi:hypothetical protein